MGNIGASYKYCRKSPCEAKREFFEPSSSLGLTFFRKIYFFENFDVFVLAYGFDGVFVDAFVYKNFCDSFIVFRQLTFFMSVVCGLTNFCSLREHRLLLWLLDVY